MTVYRAAGVDYRVATLNYDGSTQPVIAASISGSSSIAASIEHNPVITASISGSASVSTTIIEKAFITASLTGSSSTVGNLNYTGFVGIGLYRENS